ncbi:MAG TPA: hypothetical protein DCL44_09905 [Elusimicrobia bacterium]|nr:hypothetical protein [Elusimicrobiota bacterium]
MEIKAIGIVGSSAVGTALAEIFLQNGFQVRIYDDFKDSLGVSLAKINWSLSREGKGELFSNIEGIQDLTKFKGADILIETLPHDMEDRKAFFAKLKKVLEPSCVIAANCSVTPLKKLIENTELPEELTVGFNFVQPVRSNQLVELVKTDHTGDTTLEACLNLLRKINKTPVIVKDNPGQIVERLLRPFILSALKVLEEGKGRPYEIDAAFKEIGQLPCGPFEAADFIGLDEDYKATQEIYTALGSPERLAPSATELRLVQYGQLGRKSTIGFYIYEDGKIVGENPVLPNILKYLGLKQTSKEEIFTRILSPIIDEAKILASEIMASEYDVETAVKLAFGWPKGPFAYARDLSHLLEKKKVSEFDKLDAY